MRDDKRAYIPYFISALCVANGLKDNENITLIVQCTIEIIEIIRCFIAKYIDFPKYFNIINIYALSYNILSYFIKLTLIIIVKIPVSVTYDRQLKS